MRARALFLTDLLLLITFIPAVVTGFGLHWAGHQNCHNLWHNWAVAHALFTLIFAIVAAVHIYGHWGWYKSLFNNGLGNKSRVTVLLTALMLAAVVTGNIVLFRHQGANSDLGLLHYALGILLTIFSLGHFAKRCKLLFKNLRKR